MVDPVIAAIIGTVVMVVFLFSGMSIAIALALGGMVGLYLTVGTFGQTFAAIPVQAFRGITGKFLLALPMFIWMGNLVGQFGFGTDGYDTAYKWLGRLPGGLAIASIVFGALFGFACGSSLAGLVTVGGVAFPEMEKRGYNRSLAAGTLLVAGSLSVLIPPSILMIVYAMQSQVSMGKLFFAGIFPGLLLTAVVSLYILAVCAVNPSWGPRGEKFAWSDKLTGLSKILPLFLIMVAILGGIYTGWCTPMEAGAAGTFVVICIVLAYRRFSWRIIIASLRRTVEILLMIYVLIAGIRVLTFMYFITGVDEIIRGAIVGLPLAPLAIIIVMLFCMTIMGMFMPVMVLLLVMTPITLPVILDFGYSGIWWGIMLILISELAMITPPFGACLFVCRSVAPKGTTDAQIYRGVFPMVGVVWVCILLLVFFPEIAMFLPDMMTM